MSKERKTEFIRVPLSPEKIKQIRKRASAPSTMSDAMVVRSFIDTQLHEL